MSPVGVGVIGAGVISDEYLTNLSSFPDVEVVIVGDLDPARARARAEQHGVRLWGQPEDVLAHPAVQVVVNLTTPAAHVAVSRAAIEAGKHVWTEKPIGLRLDEVDDMLAAANAAGVRVGCAPDTVLGSGVQTAKRAVESGLIGTPLFVQTAFQTRGPDLWHPNPAFLFAEGAGPLFDMGPYYFTALVHLFGSVERVAALGLTSATEREIRHGSLARTKFPVKVPTTMQVLTSFAGGQQASSVLSFDATLERAGVVEIHGTEGTLVMPDPNMFEGPTSYLMWTSQPDSSPAAPAWIALKQQGARSGRGLGLLEMVRAIAEDRPHRASGALGRHVLEVMLAAEQSARSGEFVPIESSVATLAGMPIDFDPLVGTLEAASTAGAA